MRLLEDARDLRHHVREEKEQDGRAQDQHDGRVGEGAPHLAEQARLVLGVVGEAIEDDVQRTARLAGAYHVDVERREEPGMLRQGVGERAALGHLLADLRQRARQGRTFRLLGKRSQGLDQGQPRRNQGAELTRDRRELGGRHPLGPARQRPRRGGGRRAPLLAQIRGEHPRAPELLSRAAWAVGVDDAPDRSTADVEPAIGVERHQRDGAGTVTAGLLA